MFNPLRRHKAHSIHSLNLTLHPFQTGPPSFNHTGRLMSTTIFDRTYSYQLLHLQYHRICSNMSHNQPPLIKTRSSSLQNKKKGQNAISKRQTVQFEQHLDLKERGSKYLKNIKKLLPNQPIMMLKRLVQKGTDNIKKQILPQHNLLPALTTKNILLQLIHEQQSNTFQQVSQQLTMDMLSFHRNVAQALQTSDMGQIVRMQTQKCRRNIPKEYFQAELGEEAVNELLTRQRIKALQLREALGDYLDEVEFNVNQQVTYKLSIFMSFVGYLTNLRQLADLSIAKIKGTRQNNQVIRHIVIQKAQTVNRLRKRKEEVEQVISALNKIKKLKKIEDWFMSQVHAKGKITSMNQYPEYCSLHEQLKGYCCPRMLCRFFDVAYYIQRGYSDSFTRSLKNYLTEIIVIDQKQISDICFPSKTNFATTTPGTLFTSLTDVGTNLDQSLELDQDEIELVSKHNIERQIVSIYKQGLHKCSYSTDQICDEIKNTIGNCQLTLFNLIRGKHNLIQEPMNKTDKKTALDKLSTHKYVRVVEHWSERMKKVVKRQLAIVERALRATKDLVDEQPQKYEVMCSYLMQILYLTFTCIDESLSFLISSRKFKQQESQSIKQILLYEQQWKQLILEQKHFPAIWEQFQVHFLQEQFEVQHKENKIVEGLIGNLKSTRRNIVQIMINGYNSTAIDSLIKNLQQDYWKVASIPSRFNRTLGQIVYGKVFTKDLEQAQLKMLSSSLLLDRNSSSFSTFSISAVNDSPPVSQEPIKTQQQLSNLYQIHLSQSMLKLQGKPFKLTTSSIAVCQTLQGYLEWIDQSSDGERIQQHILKKIQEYLSVYNNYVRELILEKKALNYGKIKIKSITGKHLLITFAQLKFISTVNHHIAERYPKYQDSSQTVRQKLQKHMSDVAKKFKSVLQLSIRQSINKIVVDPRTEIKWPIRQSQEIVSALSHSKQYVQDILMSDNQMGQFISVNWCSLYLQKLKGQYKSVYKQIMNSNGTRKSKDIDWTDNIYWKYKELEYIVQNLKQLQEFMPGFGAILEELEMERKKVENPH